MLTPEELIKRQQDALRKEHQEHQDVLKAIGEIIKTKDGQTFFSYLFKNFEVTTLPDRSMEGNILHEYLGFLRAGSSIYKLACEANSEMAASLVAKLERQRYADLYEQHRIESDDT